MSVLGQGLGLIAWVGPTYLASIGLTGWRGALATGLVILILFHFLGRAERRAMSTTPPES